MSANDTFVRLLAQLEGCGASDAQFLYMDRKKALDNLKRFTHQDFGYDTKRWREWLESQGVIPMVNIPAEALQGLENDYPADYIRDEWVIDWAARTLREWTGQDFGKDAKKWREWLESRGMIAGKDDRQN